MRRIGQPHVLGRGGAAPAAADHHDPAARSWARSRPPVMARRTRRGRRRRQHTQTDVPTARRNPLRVSRAHSMPAPAIEPTILPILDRECRRIYDIGPTPHVNSENWTAARSPSLHRGRGSAAGVPSRCTGAGQRRRRVLDPRPREDRGRCARVGVDLAARPSSEGARPARPPPRARSRCPRPGPGAAGHPRSRRSLTARADAAGLAQDAGASAGPRRARARAGPAASVTGFSHDRRRLGLLVPGLARAGRSPRPGPRRSAAGAAFTQPMRGQLLVRLPDADEAGAAAGRDT